MHRIKRSPSIVLISRLICAFVVVLLSLYFRPAQVLAAYGSSSDTKVVIETNVGRILIRLAPSYAPNTCANFLDLVERGFYNGLSFHRVESWVVQGGDPNGNGSGHFIDPETGEPRYLNLETHRMLRHNAPGIVAMARSNHPNSASCQFYILKRQKPELDGKYAVFGKVIGGLDVIYKIRQGDTIQRIYVVEPPPAQDEVAPEFPNPGEAPNQGSPPSRQSTPRQAPPSDSGF